MWLERNTRIFKDKARTLEVLWDTIYFLTSFWASCTTTFKSIPINVVQLDWLSVCRSKGVGLKVWANKARLLCVLYIWFMVHHKCFDLLSILEVPIV